MHTGNRSQAAALLYGGRKTLHLRKEGDAMITYSDLFQFCIVIINLVGLCYEIFKGNTT